MKLLSNLHPAWIAGLILIAVLLWLASGINPTEAPADQTASAEEKAPKLVKVEITASQAQAMLREAIVSARTAPVRSVRVRAQTSGRVSEIVAQRGALITKGAVIARIALDERQAQLRQAKAVLQQRSLQYKAAERLHKQDYMTEVELAQSKANLEIAQAEVDRTNKDISHTVLRAPFTGVLDQRPVEVGDYVKVGDEIGYVIEQDPFIVRGSVSEDQVALLKVGQSGSATLINDEIREGKVRYISGEADEQTRTYQVELEIPNPQGRLIAGTSAQLRLPLEEVSAHQLEPAVLTLNKDGEFGIKSVDKSNHVHFHKADIVRNEEGKVWLSGLPETLEVITVGQGFVSAGDKVIIDRDGQAAQTQPAAADANE